jgi:hypothetical protein
MFAPRASVPSASCPRVNIEFEFKFDYTRDQVLTTRLVTMSASAETLSPPVSTASSRGLPAALEVLLIAALFLGLMAASVVFQIVLGAQIALISCVVLITVFQRLRGETWRDLGMRSPRTLTSFALGSVLCVAIFILANALNGALAAILPQILGDSGAERTLPSVTTWMDYLTFMAIIWTTDAFAEEMVFRGFFMTRIAEAFGRGVGAWTLALVLPAALFGAAHFPQGLAGVLITGSIGLLFGLGYLVGRRNLWPLIIAHGMINTVAVTILFLIAQGALPESALPGL